MRAEKVGGLATAALLAVSAAGCAQRPQLITVPAPKPPTNPSPTPPVTHPGRLSDIVSAHRRAVSASVLRKVDYWLLWFHTWEAAMSSARSSAMINQDADGSRRNGDRKLRSSSTNINDPSVPSNLTGCGITLLHRTRSAKSPRTPKPASSTAPNRPSATPAPRQRVGLDRSHHPPPAQPLRRRRTRVPLRATSSSGRTAPSRSREKQ